jgi:excisionase family DNA binding protein
MPKATSITVERIAWSVSEVSRSTGLSPSFVRKQIKLGKLRGRKKGRRLLVMNKDLRAYLDGK